jgi:hypothetical protein
MKKTITLLTLCLIGTLSLAQQAPAIQWQKCLGGTNYEVANSVQTTPDGGYILAGYTQSSDGDVTGNHGEVDVWVAKLSAAGALEWQKTLGGTNNEFSCSILCTVDGGYIMAGYTISINGDVNGNHGNFDIWLVKLSATGNLMWQKTLGGTGDDYAQSIQSTADGGYIIAGYTGSTNGDVIGNHGYSDAWVVKLSAIGAMEWQKALGGTSYDWATSIQNTSDGGYIVAGYTASTDGDVTGNHGSNDAWVVKLGTTGAMEWQKTLGGTGDDFANCIQPTTDSGYIVAGNTQSTDGEVIGNHGGVDAWVVKLGATGAILWQKAFGGTSDDFANSIHSMPNDGYIMTGYTVSTDGDVSGNHGSFDAWVLKLSATGTLLWQKTLGGTGEDRAYSIQPTTDSGYIVAGITASTNGDITGNHGNADAWVVKLGPELSTTGFIKEAIVVYPNPAKAMLNVQNNHQMPFEKIVITDLMGKIVLTQTTNTNQINIEPLASGMYLLEATSGGAHLVSKFVKE